jgi:hypothetical protein
VAHLNARSCSHNPHLARVVGRLCRCFREHYALGQFVSPQAPRLPALQVPRSPS